MNEEILKIAVYASNKSYDLIYEGGDIKELLNFLDENFKSWEIKLKLDTSFEHCVCIKTNKDSYKYKYEE